MNDKVLSSPYPVLWQIQDVNHQVWVLQGGILKAVPRKDHLVPVTVTLISCQHTETLEKDRGNPIYLGVKEPELCLFCTEVQGQPMLQLKEQNIMELYRQPQPVKPFLFYHDRSGRTSTFESVAFPGWFIASCSDGGCPLIITQDVGKAYTTDFGFTVLSYGMFTALNQDILDPDGKKRTWKFHKRKNQKESSALPGHGLCLSEAIYPAGLNEE